MCEIFENDLHAGVVNEIHPFYTTGFNLFRVERSINNRTVTRLVKKNISLVSTLVVYFLMDYFFADFKICMQFRHL